MNNASTNFHENLLALEKKIESLISLCERLREENQSLKMHSEDWARERAQLIEKTAIAKNRVESMIARLKQLGHIS